MSLVDPRYLVITDIDRLQLGKHPLLAVFPLRRAALTARVQVGGTGPLDTNPTCPVVSGGGLSVQAQRSGFVPGMPLPARFSARRFHPRCESFRPSVPNSSPSPSRGTNLALTAPGRPDHLVSLLLLQTCRDDDQAGLFLDGHDLCGHPVRPIRLRYPPHARSARPRGLALVVPHRGRLLFIQISLLLGHTNLTLTQGLLTMAIGLLSFLFMPAGPTQTASWFRGKNGWYTPRQVGVTIVRGASADQKQTRRDHGESYH